LRFSEIRKVLTCGAHLSAAKPSRVAPRLAGGGGTVVHPSHKGADRPCSKPPCPSAPCHRRRPAALCSSVGKAAALPRTANHRTHLSSATALTSFLPPHRSSPSRSYPEREPKHLSSSESMSRRPPSLMSAAAASRAHLPFPFFPRTGRRARAL
jgi:hypothetical protein